MIPNTLESPQQTNCGQHTELNAVFEIKKDTIIGQIQQNRNLVLPKTATHNIWTTYNIWEWNNKLKLIKLNSTQREEDKGAEDGILSKPF